MQIFACNKNRDLLKYLTCVTHSTLKGGAKIWQSVISVAKAFTSEMQSATPIEDPTRSGNLILSLSRLKQTAVQEECTYVLPASDQAKLKEHNKEQTAVTSKDAQPVFLMNDERS